MLRKSPKNGPGIAADARISEVSHTVAVMPGRRVQKRDRSPRRAVPQARPGVAQLDHQSTQGRQGEPDDRGRVAGDVGDERCSETVNRERAGHEKRFIGSNVRVELSVANVVGEGNLGDGDCAERAACYTIHMLDQPVAGIQLAGATALEVPTLPGFLCRVRFAINNTVDHEDGISTQNEISVALEPARCRSDGLRRRFGLGAGEQLHNLGRRERPALLPGCSSRYGILIDVRGNSHGFDPRRAQQCEPCG